MIEIDRRAGSVELATIIKAYGSRTATKTQVVELEFGDFAFAGNGPHGTCKIGVERKTLKDLLNSMRTGRLAGHQLPGMLRAYDYCYLVVEGIYRGNPETGLLEHAVRGGWREVRIASSGFMHAAVDNYLTSLETQTPIHIRNCATLHDTALFLVNLHQWFQKRWDSHQSCKVIYDPFPARALFQRTSLVRKIAAQLPGIGYTKSAGIEAVFPAVVDMVVADEKDWAKLPGIDKVLSRRIVRALTEPEKRGGKKDVN